MVRLPADIMTVEPARIPETRALLTIVNGTLVHEEPFASWPGAVTR